jgi:hypothetical protein
MYEYIEGETKFSLKVSIVWSAVKEQGQNIVQHLFCDVNFQDTRHRHMAKFIK